MQRFIYTVRPGDTLSKLAQMFSTTVADILNNNAAVENPNLIRVGQALIIRGAEPDGAHAQMSETENPADEPVWLKIAQREIGTTEISGPAHNSRVIEYLMSCETLDANAQRQDETFWCSAFVNWVVEKSGMRGTDSAWALTWENWGREIDEPRLGAIAVFSRDDGGHVGFLLKDLGDKVRILGGNQSNTVKAAEFPKNGRHGGQRYKLKGYRWPQ